MFGLARTLFLNFQKRRKAATVTAVGDAQISTAQSKFGGSSLLLDGAGDYLDVASVVSTSSQFTIEGWFYVTDKTTLNIGAVWQGDYGDNQRRHQVYFTYNLPGFENKIYIALGSGGSYSFLSVDYTVPLNTWFHLAITRDSFDDIRWFIDGVQQGATQNNTKAFFPTSALTQRLGDISYESGDFKGYIDEFRISDIYRYNMNFTPSTTAFVNDKNTLLLLHMDGTNGSTVFTDDNS